MNKFLVSFLSLALFLLLYSCSSHFPDYSKTRSGIYYKIITIGEGDKRPKKDDLVAVNFTILPGNQIAGDSFSDLLSGVKTFQVSKYNPFVEEVIKKLNAGDSVAIMFPYSLFYDKNELFADSFISVGAKLINIIPYAELEKHEKKFAEWENGNDSYEHNQLLNYIKKNNITVLPDEEGMYFIGMNEGKGNYLVDGNTAYIRYIGSFLDGTVFDNSYENEEPLEVRIGVQGHAIKGIEKALYKMKKGAKAKIILPSHLAYGERGSSTGIVPPSSSVIYEVEIVKVN